MTSPFLVNTDSGSLQVEELLSLIRISTYDAVVEYTKLGAVPTLNSTDPHPLDKAEDTLALKKAIRILEGACSMLCDMLAPPAHTIINRTQNLDRECLRVALDAKVSDILHNYPEGLHASKISERVGIEEGKLGRVLRLLATKHCFQEVQANVFANNRLSVVLHSRNNVAILAKMHTILQPISGRVFHDNLTNPTYSHSYETSKAPFMQAVKDENIEGGFFDWAKRHPEILSMFTNAMLGMGEVMGTLSTLHHYPWKGVSSLCDVGSGIGHFTVPLLRKFPHIQAFLFDSPEVLKLAEKHWIQENPEAVASEKVIFAPGDFFIEVPPEARGLNVYYLRNIIHNWPDERARKILSTISKAMGPQSRLLIHDCIINDASYSKSLQFGKEKEMDQAPEPLLSNFGPGNIRLYNQDITMLLYYNSKERTIQDIVTLVMGLNLQLDKVWDMGETCMLELTKL